MMSTSKELPYEYYNGKLGVKMKFLTSNRDQHEKSLCLISYKALNEHIKSNNFPERQLRKPSRGYDALIEFDSLCQDWKAELKKQFGEAEAEIKQSYFAKHYTFDQKAFDFYSGHTYGELKKNLDADKIDEYTFNASVLNTVLTIKNNRRALRQTLGGSTTDIWETLSIEVNNFKEVAHTLHLHKDNLRHKATKYVKEGYPALISGRMSNNNARKVDDSILNLLNRLFAKQDYKPTPTEVFRTYEAFLNGYAEVFNPETGELYNPADFKKLSKATVTNYINSWENAIATHQIRSGNRQVYMAKYKPHNELEVPQYAGSIISIDDRQPPFWYEKGKRVWFYIAIDLASGCITAFVYGKTKEGIILDFYRQLVRNYTEWGICLPDGLECESSLNSSYKETLLKEGAMFQNVRIEANNARGKRIERYFGAMRYGAEKQAEGWIARPFAKQESQQAGPGENKIIPYAQLVEGRLKEIEDWNNTAHFREKEVTRWEYFMEKQQPKLKPTNWKAILPYVGYKTESSCNVGYVALQGRKRMIAENGAILSGDDLIIKMKRIEGRDVDVYWLDGNDGQVLKAMAFIGNEFICELLPIPRYNRAVIERTPQCEENRLIQTKYAATIEAFMRTRRNSFEPIVVIDHTPKTLNRKFQISGITRYQADEGEVEEVPDYNDEEMEIINQNNPNKGWASAYNY